MGGAIDSGVSICTHSSPHQTAIEKAQAELRLEHNVREERRRELEFLEKGGNPLDLRFGISASISVQSTSITDQQLHCQFVTSEAKGSFALATLLRGDSIESSGRLEAAVACELHSADNFDCQNELIEDERKFTWLRSNITPSEHSSQLVGGQNFRESEDSPILQPKKAYRRRKRSNINRDTSRSSSTNITSHGGPNSSLPSRHRVVPKAVVQESPSPSEMDVSVTKSAINCCFSEGQFDVSTSKHLHGGMRYQNIKDDGAPADMTSGQPDSFMGREQTISAVGECPPCPASAKTKDDADPKQLSEPNELQGDKKCLQTEDYVNNIAVVSKGLDYESSCTRTSVSLEGKRINGSELYTSLKNVDSIAVHNEQKVPFEQTINSKDEMALEDREVSSFAEYNSCLNNHRIPQDCQSNRFPDKDEKETNKSRNSALNEANIYPNSKEMLPNHQINPIPDKKHGSSDAFIPEAESCCPEKSQGLHDPSVCVLKKIDINRSVLAEELQPSAGNQTKVVEKAREDQILEEGRTIEVKRKRIKELSVGPPAKEYCRKSHWDFVLEEMAWMANDFAQERLWKRKAGAQLCHEAAFASQKAKELNKNMKIKVVAQTLAKAVMEFWKSAGLPSQETGIVSGLQACGKAASESMDDNHKMDGVSRSNNNEESHSKNVKVSVQTYALGFMQQNSSVLSIMSSEAFRTTERSSLIDMPEMTALDKYAEEDLFYVVQHGAMQAYRKPIEVYMMQCERAGKTMQEVIDTSINYALAEFVSEEKKYEEEGGDLYYLPGAFEGCQLSKSLQKKQKNPKSYTPTLHDLGDHFSSRAITPIKRVHTAPKQTTAGPFNTGGDASCGDTNSFHDEESTLHDGYLIPKGLEVESGMDFDKLSTFGFAEITKHQGAAYDQSWQVDFNMKSGQRNQFKKRMGTHQFEFNCSGGPFGLHAKKPKTVKQSLDNSFGTTALMTSSVASLVGSQMGNMSNPNKLIKLVSSRDCGKKPKSLKMPSGETGSGILWSLFEDEALVVLVHDMGPNWGLVSDAINNTLHFKSIFRTPKECKERHRILIEQTYGDGAGSAEDSGSSRPYPSILPGIPKGGARQLFLQLRGPIEEDIIKSHLVKIILPGQQQLRPRNNQEPKQLVSVHGSHNAALLQVFPNNVNGCVLMPLDLCDMAASSPDVFSPNSQGPHNSDLLSANQGTSLSVLPSSGTNSSLQVLPAAQLNDFVRDGRYGVPSASLSIDEQQRLQQHKHALYGGNIHQINVQVPDAFIENDQGLHTLPGRNGMVMPGINRSMAMPIPGLQGISSSSMLNSVSMAASNMLTVPNSVKMHSRAIPGQGNSAPIQNSEHQVHVVPSTLADQSISPSSYPVHHNHQHQLLRQHSTILSNSHHPHLQGSAYPVSAEQQAFTARLARERQLQQHALPRQNSSLMQLQASSQPVPQPPLTSSPVTPVSFQQQQKHHRLDQTPQAGTGEMIDQEGKQRQTHAQQLHQQVRQSVRYHPSQCHKVQVYEA